MRGERFDALISDFAMPGLTGVNLIAEARAIQPGLAALLISGYAGAGAVDEKPSDTMVLWKPFQRAQLLEALRLTMHPGGDEVDQAAPIPAANDT